MFLHCASELLENKKEQHGEKRDNEATLFSATSLSPVHMETLGFFLKPFAVLKKIYPTKLLKVLSSMQKFINRLKIL